MSTYIYSSTVIHDSFLPVPHSMPYTPAMIHDSCNAAVQSLAYVEVRWNFDWTLFEDYSSYLLTKVCSLIHIIGWKSYYPYMSYEST